MEVGLFPRLGFIAAGCGETESAIHAYTDSSRVRDEVSPAGDYHHLVWAAYGEEELCILRMTVNPDKCTSLAGRDAGTIRILNIIPPNNILVLDTNMHQLSPEEYDRLCSAGVGARQADLPL